MTRKEYIQQDVRMEYYPTFSKEAFLDWLLQSEQYHVRKYVKYLRSEEYYTFIHPNRWKRWWYYRKKNKLGSKLGFIIFAGCFGPDLRIWHYGSIIVNPNAHIGSGCNIHGNCCIGNRGTRSKYDSPTIGNNVDIGQGAQILGTIQIADNVKIGAGAIVTRSCLEEGTTLVGIPAKPLQK